MTPQLLQIRNLRLPNQRPRSNATARWLLMAAFVTCLVGIGGKANWTLATAAALTAAAAAWTLIAQPHRRQNNLSWLAPASCTCAMLLLWQLFGPGWNPLLLADGLNEILPHAEQQTLNKDRTQYTAIWWLLFFTFMLTGSQAWRQSHLPQLINIIITIGGLHAIFGLMSAQLIPNWPTEVYSGRVRGTFVYPNQAAAFWGAILPLAAYQAYRQKSIGALLAALALTAAIAGSASRGGVISAAIVQVLFWLRTIKKEHRVWLIPCAIAAILWLLTLGSQTVTDRFAQLENQGSTLNGRTLIWQYALSIWPETGWSGAGAGCQGEAFMKAGMPPWGNKIILNMHSDPLQILLQFGWLGGPLLLVTLGGGMCYLVWRVEPWRNPNLPDWAVTCGISMMLLHGLGDHILESEANALLLGLFCCILMTGQPDSKSIYKTKSGRPKTLRIVTITSLAVLMVSWPHFVTLERQHKLSNTAHRLLNNQLAQGITPQTDPLGILATPAHATNMAIQQAHLALVQKRPERAAEAIHQGLKLSPGNAKLWLFKAWNTESIEQRFAALDQTARSAPTWAYGRRMALFLLDETAQPERQKPHIMTLLTSQKTVPDWLATRAVGIFGSEIIDSITNNPTDFYPNVRAKFRPWLQEQDNLQALLATWNTPEETPGPIKLETESWGLAPYLEGTNGMHQAQHRLSQQTPENYARAARRLRSIGLPIPPTLDRAVSTEPWTALANTPQWHDPQWRQQQRSLLAQWQFTSWAQKRWAELDRYELGNAQPQKWTRNDRPEWIAASHQKALETLANTGAEPYNSRTQAENDRRHTTGLLQRYHRPIWSNYGKTQIGRWYRTSDQHLHTTNVPVWVGTYINGNWKGWHKGPLALHNHCEPGKLSTVIFIPLVRKNRAQN